MTDDHRLSKLEANARHTSERYRLYQAKVFGSSPTSPERLRRLQRESERAEGLLVGSRAARARR